MFTNKVRAVKTFEQRYIVVLFLVYLLGAREKVTFIEIRALKMADIGKEDFKTTPDFLWIRNFLSSK